MIMHTSNVNEVSHTKPFSKTFPKTVSEYSRKELFEAADRQMASLQGINGKSEISETLGKVKLAVSTVKEKTLSGMKKMGLIPKPLEISHPDIAGINEFVGVIQAEGFSKEQAIKYINEIIKDIEKNGEKADYGKISSVVSSYVGASLPREVTFDRELEKAMELAGIKEDGTRLITNA